MSPDAPPDFADPQSLPRHPFVIVGIGASAGGLKPLQALFGRLPGDVEAAFVVVQHLSPDFESMMTPLLERHAHLPVESATDGVEPEAGRVYLLPPGHGIVMRDGLLRFTPRPGNNHLHLPIDDFLHSLAREQGENAMAIVLSGTGSDGSRGVVSVRQAGGLVMVQDPETAEFDGMPKASRDTGLVDFEGSPEELADAIVRRVLSGEADPAGHEPTALEKIISVVGVETGLDLSRYREGTLRRRLNRRVQLLGHTDLPQYLDHLRQDANEPHQLKQEVLIGVTALFRDAPVWTHLIEKVLPELIERPREGPLRAWIAGCSTGEEAYSLTIAILEACRSLDLAPDFKVFATDVNAQALRRASDGLFPPSSMEEVPSALLDRYFDRSPGGWSVRRVVRERLTFATHNLLADPPFTRIDIATCRNVLIYLQPDAQAEVLGRLHFGLVQKGVLVLGESESVGVLAKHFAVRSKRHQVYEAVGRAPLQSTLLRPLRQRGTRGRIKSTELEELHSAVIRKYAPPGVATDAGLDVLHVFGDVSPYLSLPEGQVTTNLQHMISPAASVLVTSAAARVLEHEQQVSIPGLTLGPDVRCDIVVARFRRSAMDDYGLLVFFETPRGPEDPANAVVVDEAITERVRLLEDELDKTRRHLRSAVEELETSNEELQATNEELIASNEELQSTNEEMQSVNEELYTVNAEYQEKINQLGELSDDLDHLLHNLEVGTVFLDENLCVRRYNALATEVVPLLENDMGRPVTDLAWRIDPTEVLVQVERALAGRPTEAVDVAQDGGRHWRIVVRTHTRRRDARNDGALLTIVDVTPEHRAAERLAEANLLNEVATRLAHVMVAMVDQREQTVKVNDVTRRALGLAAGETLSHDTIMELLAGDPTGQATNRRILRVRDKEIPVRVFARPGPGEYSLVVAFQALTPLTAAIAGED